MTAHKLRASRLLSPEALAGWIFADLLIVLFIIGLGAAAAPTPITEEPPPPPPPTSPPPPKPPKPPKQALVPKAVEMTVRVDPDRLSAGGKQRASQLRSVCSQLKEKLRDAGHARDKAALVLIFAGGDDVTSAQRRATIIGRGLEKCRRQPVFNKGLVFRDFWDGDPNFGERRARLEIFVYTK